MPVSYNSASLYGAFSVKDFQVLPDESRVHLDKWPACLVTGLPIDKDVAAEFIRRTDQFFCHGYDGNDHTWVDKVRRLVGMPPDDLYDNEHYSKEYVSSLQARGEFFRLRWMPLENIRLLSTARVSSAYIQGYYGIVDFDGNIYHWKNIGRYPSVEEVKTELEILGHEFPCLELRLTLFNEYHADIQPVISLWLKQGKVTLTEPVPEKVHLLPVDTDTCFSLDFKGETDPHITEDVIRQWAIKAGTYVGG